MKVVNIRVLIIVLLLVSCGSSYHISNHQVNNIKINGDSLKLYDTALANIIAPYSKQLNSQMNVVIGSAQQNLNKELPDGCLGNMVADACLWYAKKHTGATIDFCVLNNGGIRIPAIQQGEISTGKIFELMPFDNTIVTVAMSGQQCKRLFNWIVQLKGAPVSGLQLAISEKNYTNPLINSISFDEQKQYTIATTDFLANGGDAATMFAEGVITSTPVKLRDAIIAYIKNEQTLKANNNGRITTY